MFDFILRLARSKAGRKLVGLIFSHMSFAIPTKRLRETETLLAFYHPKPAYPLHVVLVPKEAIPNLLELDPTSAFLSDLFTTVQSLITEFQLPAYRLIVNGGEYQDFPYLHFHLISDSPKADSL
jgi:histidine triad (HIT) family protein